MRATTVNDAQAAPTLTPRLLRDIRVASAATYFKFVYDADGQYGQAGSFYFAFVGSGTYEGQRHVIRGRFCRAGGDHAYPQSAPMIYFLTPMFHSNVGTGPGERGICLNILQEKWSAINTLETVFNYVIALLCEPNPASPLNGEAARYKDPAKLAAASKEYYEARIGQFTELLGMFFDEPAASSAADAPK